jgi:hypothetical protein
MAVGEPPERVLIAIPQGLWRRPLWEGVEIKAALIAIILVIIGAMTKMLIPFIILFVAAMVWFYLFRNVAERDPDAFSVTMQNRDLFGADQMPANKTVDTKPYTLPKSLSR